MTDPPRLEPAPTWPGASDIVLILTQAEHYIRTLTSTLAVLLERFETGVVITANRPVGVLRQLLADAGIPHERLKFVDCITALTGIAPPNEPDAIYIDSPTLMEKTGLRAEQLLRRLPANQRFLFVDSLSTLAVYNGNEAVAEMAHNLTNRMRLLETGTGLLLVQGNNSLKLQQDVKAHCDHVRDG